MARIIISFLLFTSSLVTAQSSDTLTQEYRYVLAYHGLNLRSEPTTDSKIIGKIDHGTKVMILKEDTKMRIIDHRKSHWVKVNADGNIGYLFSGYLVSQLPPNYDMESFECSTSQNMARFIRQQLRKDTIIHGGAKQMTKKLESNNEVYHVNWTYFSSGDSYTSLSGPESTIWYYGSYNLSMVDVLNLLEYHSDYYQDNCPESKLDLMSIKTYSNDSGDIVKIKSLLPTSIVAYTIGLKTIIEIDDACIQ